MGLTPLPLAPMSPQESDFLAGDPNTYGTDAPSLFQDAMPLNGFDVVDAGNTPSLDPFASGIVPSTAFGPPSYSDGVIHVTSTAIPNTTAPTSWWPLILVAAIVGFLFLRKK